LLDVIYAFRSISKFHDYISIEDLFEVLKLSSDVDVKQDTRDFKDGTDPEVIFFIRKK